MNDRKVEILYRKTRYGKWNLLAIEIKAEEKYDGNIRDYVVEYLRQNEIVFLQMQVIKVSDV